MYSYTGFKKSMESFLFCHWMPDDEVEYKVYSNPSSLATCSKILFLNYVPLSLNIFNDPPILEYTLSI